MEVGVGNPAEETRCHPNNSMLRFCNALSTKFRKSHWRIRGDAFGKFECAAQSLHRAAAGK
jgi:DNA-binding ferritin-like protein